MFHVKQKRAMRKSFILINPESGSRQGTKWMLQIVDLWNASGIVHDIYVTKNHADIGNGVRKAIADNATEIIVVGGDGTLLTVVNALEDAPMLIGVVPCGTGNDFARTNGVPLDIKSAIEELLSWNTVRDIDIGNSNGSHFLNVASMGIDAEIVKRTHQVRKWMKGPLVYLIASLIEIFNYKPIRITMDIDGCRYERIIELVAIANGRCYGGGMRIAPMANPSDGIYDIILAEKMSRLRLIRLLPKLYTGRHIGEKGVETYQGKNISIHTLYPVAVNRDGELSDDTKLCIQECRRKMRLIGNI